MRAICCVIIVALYCIVLYCIVDCVFGVAEVKRGEAILYS